VTGGNEWLGIVQTLKTFIIQNIVEKAYETSKNQDKQLTEMKSKMSGLESETSGLKAELKSEMVSQMSGLK